MFSLVSISNMDTGHIVALLTILFFGTGVLAFWIFGTEEDK